MSDLWIKELKIECDKASQRAVAKKMGYSATTINMVLNGYYLGDLNAIENAFNGAFKNKTINCPILGEIAVNACQKHQKQKFSANNPQRVAIYRACRLCSEFKGAKNDS
jgi:hypothetical protein